MRGEGVYIGKKKKSEMMSGRKIMKVDLSSLVKYGKDREKMKWKQSMKVQQHGSGDDLLKRL